MSVRYAQVGAPETEELARSILEAKCRLLCACSALEASGEDGDTRGAVLSVMNEVAGCLEAIFQEALRLESDLEWPRVRLPRRLYAMLVERCFGRLPDGNGDTDLWFADLRDRIREYVSFAVFEHIKDGFQMEEVEERADERMELMDYSLESPGDVSREIVDRVLKEHEAIIEAAKSPHANLPDGERLVIQATLFRLMLEDAAGSVGGNGSSVESAPSGDELVSAGASDNGEG